MSWPCFVPYYTVIGQWGRAPHAYDRRVPTRNAGR